MAMNWYAHGLPIGLGRWNQSGISLSDQCGRVAVCLNSWQRVEERSPNCYRYPEANSCSLYTSVARWCDVFPIIFHFGSEVLKLFTKRLIASNSGWLQMQAWQGRTDHRPLAFPSNWFAGVFKGWCHLCRDLLGHSGLRLSWDICTITYSYLFINVHYIYTFSICFIYFYVYVYLCIHVGRAPSQ